VDSHLIRAARICAEREFGEGHWSVADYLDEALDEVERLTVSREELENTKDAYWSQIIIQRREIAELLKQLTKSEKRRDIEREARAPVCDIIAENEALTARVAELEAENLRLRKGCFR
jgi:hypothetical protein